MQPFSNLPGLEGNCWMFGIPSLFACLHQALSSQRAQVTSCQHRRKYVGPHTEDRSHAGLGAVLRFLVRVWPQSEVTVKRKIKQQERAKKSWSNFYPIPLKLGSNGCFLWVLPGQQAVIRKKVLQEWLLEQFSLGYVNANFSQIQCRDAAWLFGALGLHMPPSEVIIKIWSILLSLKSWQLQVCICPAHTQRVTSLCLFFSW